MANKYSISYIYEIIDKYSAPLKKIETATNRARAATKRAAESAAKFGKSMQVAGLKATAFLTAPLALLGKGMIDAASDAEETRSKFATIFNGMNKQAESVADSFAKNYGLAGSSSRKLLGDTSDMLSGFGFAQEAALKLSLETNQLAIDLASFTNFAGGAEGASAALTKALLGERESVKSLGIAIVEEDVKKKIALMRSQGMRFATNREAKAYATLKIAIDQSKNAIGDYSRTKKAYANTVRRTSEKVRELKESFGRILLPAAIKVMAAIEKLIDWFNGLSNGTKKTIIYIAGLVAIIGPLILVLGTAIALLPLIVKGLAAVGSVLLFLLSPVSLVLAAIAAITHALYKFHKVNRVVIAKFVDNFVTKIVNGFNAAKDFVMGWVDWFGKIIDGIFDVIGQVKDFIGFGDKSIEVNHNVAAQSQANKNTLNGSIDVTANNAKINSVMLKSTAPGNLGMNIAGAM